MDLCKCGAPADDTIKNRRTWRICRECYNKYHRANLARWRASKRQPLPPCACGKKHFSEGKCRSCWRKAYNESQRCKVCNVLGLYAKGMCQKCWYRAYKESVNYREKYRESRLAYNREYNRKRTLQEQETNPAEAFTEALNVPLDSIIAHVRWLQLTREKRERAEELHRRIAENMARYKKEKQAAIAYTASEAVA
jgi:hypothetical protein